MVSKSHSELEAELQASDARYRELVQETLSIVRRNSGLGNEAPTDLDEIDRQRRMVLRECNRLFAQLQEVSMEKNVLTYVGEAETVENLAANKRDGVRDVRRANDRETTPR